MPANPDTRESLILRLPSASDADAWQEFIDLYEPLVIRFARRRGLQDADAREIAQNVFISVAKAVDRWQPDRERGKFRAWLFRIARNQLINWVAKHSRERGSGRTCDVIAMTQLKATPQQQDSNENSCLYDDLHRCRLARWNKTSIAKFNPSNGKYSTSNLKLGWASRLSTHLDD